MTPIAEGVQRRTGVGTRRAFRFRYDFASLGGAAGAITLTDVEGRAMQLPDNFEMVNAYTVAITPMTSGGSATVALGITGNTDCFKAATAMDHADWDVADDMKAVTNELPLKTTAAVSVLATVATAALTAGKFDVIVEGFEGA